MEEADSVRRMIIGLETEYGISLPEGDPERDPHPMYISNHVIRAYADLVAHMPSSGWDFSTETPLADMRGFSLERDQAIADQLTDIDSGLANIVLTNGARLYVDHAHPEYSSPEVSSPRDAVRWDRAGDQVMVRASRASATQLGRDVRLYKNNTDGKGASYGTHENYLLLRRTTFHRVVVQFTAYLVSRIPLIGAGRVGLGQHSQHEGFQLSQRADFFEAEVGLETTINRPIINTRDEPHADARRHRRLHVITGDATQSQVQTWVKVGAAALVLRAIEAGLTADIGLLARPVQDMSRVSHDLTLAEPLQLADGSTITALGLQQRYLDAVRLLLERHGDTFTADDRAEAHDICAEWQRLLDDLAVDPMRCADRLDWVAKYQLLQRYRDRQGLGWSAPKLAMVDLQFADLDPVRSLFAALERKGMIRTLWTADEITAAETTPPPDTRAFFRGEVMRRYGQQVAAASWDSVVFDIPGVGNWQRLPMLDPYRGTRDHVGDLLDQCDDAATLLLRMGVTGRR